MHAYKFGFACVGQRSGCFHWEVFPSGTWFGVKSMLAIVVLIALIGDTLVFFGKCFPCGCSRREVHGGKWFSVECMLTMLVLLVLVAEVGASIGKLFSACVPAREFTVGSCSELSACLRV